MNLWELLLHWKRIFKSNWFTTPKSSEDRVNSGSPGKHLQSEMFFKAQRSMIPKCKVHSSLDADLKKFSRPWRKKVAKRPQKISSVK
ncbi:hypothetical protein CDAR_290941 [Caerostris darwini]|uniref:Uncharacterized protein n=1 Tax=Caerostris darwini TaxID=1538125 RepID=A0AAV4VQF3_9ARAC|nr:hypothetical protein CDAR_290941 [Caerostris darwini]